MSFLRIEEYANLNRDGVGATSPVPGQLVKNDSITLGGASAATSAAVDGKTHYVCVTADAACYIAIGATPTATTSTTYLPADVPRFFSVKSGTDKIAALLKS